MHRSVRLSTLGVALAALAIISYHLLPSARAAASAGDSDLARLSNPDWTTPIAPFRIVGNLYYVGSRDLASYLIVTGTGDILINSNLEESVPQIAARSTSSTTSPSAGSPGSATFSTRMS